MKVGLLTLEEKQDITGQLYAPDCFFNPLQDINDNWIISTQEIKDCVVDQFMWVKELPLIDYESKPAPFPPIN